MSFQFHRKMFHGWAENALCRPVRGYHRPNESACYVLGDMFGPNLFCVGEDLQDAHDEWYERHGQRAEANDPAFLDFPEETHEERFEHALNDGTIVINGGGTTCWSDPYLWCEEFPTLRDAIRHYRDR